jgi:hypothetical protein
VKEFFLTYTNATALPYHGSIFAHHVVLNYIDANGEHHTLEGVPERKFNHNVEKLVAFSLEEGRPDGGINNTDSRFRRLKAKEGQGIGPDALNKLFPKQQFLCSRSLEAGRLSRARYCAS